MISIKLLTRHTYTHTHIYTHTHVHKQARLITLTITPYSRPEQPDQADYDEVPIEQYGMAMLRGMGWQKGSFGKHKLVDVMLITTSA